MAKRKLTDDDVRRWCNLPDDILSRILSHLFGKDYACFLSVCRSWRSAPPPIRSIPDPFSTTSESSPYPLLFHFSGNSSNCNFYDPFYNGSYAGQIPDELIDARIFFSNYGWLLMTLEDKLFFFNPFTKQRIDLPPRETYVCSRMCFSSPPTSHDCMIFGFGDHYSNACRVSLYLREENDWTELYHKTNNARFYSSYSNPVFYKGAFYFLSIDGILGVFDTFKLRNLRSCWKIIYELKYPCESIQDNFLVESDGELISICIGHMGKYVRVFRLDYDNEFRWEEVHSLGDHMIFVSRTGCISMQTRTMGNTIYFPSFNNGRNGRFYSLASRTFHSLEFASARKEFNGMRQMLHCAWITPATSGIYTEDELRWLPNPKIFEPSHGRVKVAAAPCAHPSFVLTNLQDSNNKLFFNMFDRPHNAEVIPEVLQMRTATCGYGWLFQVDWDYSDCLLLNPQTMEKIHLPQLPEIFNFCAISSSPDGPNCIVLLIHHEKHVRINFMYCRPGESEWMMVKAVAKPKVVPSSFKELENSTDSDYDEEDEKVELDSLISSTITSVYGCQGKIYGLMWGLEWVKIEFDPIFKVKQPWWKTVYLSMARNFGRVGEKVYMVESCGELFAVLINFCDDREDYDVTLNPSKITEVVVIKSDFTRNTFQQVGSLDENVAFFCYGPSCCILSSSMETGRGNCIYFIGCFSDSQNIYVYDFEDGSISVSSPFPDLDLNDFEWTALTLS